MITERRLIIVRNVLFFAFIFLLIGGIVYVMPLAIEYNTNASGFIHEYSYWDDDGSCHYRLHINEEASSERYDYFCNTRLERLGLIVLKYADAHDGVLPGGGIYAASEYKENMGYPKWANDLEGFWQAKGVPALMYRRYIKCPCDKRSLEEFGNTSLTSYELELAGENIYKIPKEKWPVTPLLIEKKFDGSHGRVYYLDGHIGYINKHQRRT